MTPTLFQELLQPIFAAAAQGPVNHSLGEQLNRDFGPGSSLYFQIRTACAEAIKAGWMCNREAGGIRFGRVIKPSEATQGFSVDVVHMGDVVGPHHVHPNGEVDLVIPLEEAALFDGAGAGWKVYEPGSAHSPTVKGGAALILYLLPGGAIEFTASA